jgi:hypothetical protein
VFRIENVFNVDAKVMTSLSLEALQWQMFSAVVLMYLLKVLSP